MDVVLAVEMEVDVMKGVDVAVPADGKLDRGCGVRPRVAKMGFSLVEVSLFCAVVASCAVVGPNAETEDVGSAATVVRGTAILRHANRSAIHRSSRTKNSKKSNLNIVVASLPMASSCGVLDLFGSLGLLATT